MGDTRRAMPRLVFLSFVLSLLAVSVRAASYSVDFSLGDCTEEGCQQILAYTEGQMFARGDGPPSFVLSDDNPAYIGLDATIRTPADWPDYGWFQFSAFACTRKFYDEHVVPLNRFCDGGYALPITGHGASNNLTKTIDEPAGTHHVTGKFSVTESKQQLLVIRVCQEAPYKGGGVQISSQMKFSNTYGLVPGKLVGYVPVYFLLTVGTGIAFAIYAAFALVHWKELLILQGLIMGVQLLSILEAATWLGYLLGINESGDPLCCPLANMAMFAIATTVTKHLVSRVLMTLVSMGFGVVRQTATCKEVAALCVLSICYFVLGFLDEVAENNSFGDGSIQFLWQFGLMGCDLVFLYWVMTALRSTMDGLAQNRSSLKFKMYRNMSTALSVFLVAWAAYGLLVMALNAVLDFGPLETTLLGSLWPVIYFAFLVTISVIWRPSTMSHMLAMSYELSTSEIDCDVELDSMADGPDDIQMPVGPARTMVSVSLDDEDESPKHNNKSLL